MKNFPFITLKQALLLLRIGTASLFLAHAVVRLLNGTVGQFADFLNNKGFVIGLPLVWVITFFEIVAGTAMMLGYYTRWMALGFIIMLVMGIVIIHAEFGWFVGEHGTGGMEYSVALIFSLLTIAAPDRK